MGGLIALRSLRLQVALLHLLHCLMVTFGVVSPVVCRVTVHRFGGSRFPYKLSTEEAAVALLCYRNLYNFGFIDPDRRADGTFKRGERL